MSTLKTVRSRWSRPWRSATARASVLGRQRPRGSTSTFSGVVPDWRAISMACVDALASREAELDDHVGQEAQRRPCGATACVTPSQCSRVRGRGERGSAELDGAQVGNLVGRSWRGMDRARAAASHHRRSAPGCRSTSARLSAPWRTRISRPSTTVHPALRRRRQELGAAVPVDEVDHARVSPRSSAPSGRSLKRCIGIAEPDRRAVDEQVGRYRRVERRARRGRRRAPRARSGRPVPDRHVGRAGLAQRPGDRAGAAARRRGRARVRPRGRLGQRGEQARRVGVVGVDRRRPARSVSVFAAPIAARALASPASASASAASLWGIVTFAPRKPAAGSARTVSSQQLGRDRAGAGSASRAQPERGAAPRCASPASGCGRRASRGRRGGARRSVGGGLSTATGPCRRAPRACGCRRRRRARTAASVDEKLCAPFAARLDDVVEAADVRPGRRRPGSTARPGLPIGVGGRPRRRRVLYGESACSSDWRSGRDQLLRA